MSDLIEHAGIDPYRLAAAAHEVAHALGFAAAGVPCLEITIKGHGKDVSGYVEPAGGIVVTDLHAFAVAHLAGRAADLRWCELHALPELPERTCRSDEQDLRTFLRDAGREAKGRGEKRYAPSFGSLRHDAHRFVCTHWSTIARLAPKLARAGHLSPNRIPLALFPGHAA